MSNKRDDYSAVNVTVIVLAVIVAAFILSGCAMIEGASNDIARMSRWTQDRLDHGFEREPVGFQIQE